MVKRMTFLEIALVASLLVIGCVCGLAVAKEKLVLKYLPVNHDVEMVIHDNTSNPIILTQTQSDSSIQNLIRDHAGCLTCRGYDLANASQCPNCCLYNNNASIHCQSLSDPDCPNPGLRPFSNTALDCSSTFKRDCNCPGPCAKFPDPKNMLTHCQRRGCPDTAAPNDASCKADVTDKTVWYCEKDDVLPHSALASANTAVTSCSFSRSSDVYDITKDKDILCDPRASSVSTGHCYRYQAKKEFRDCIDRCVLAAEKWEDRYYDYNNGTLGRRVCDYGNCKSGFGDTSQGSVSPNCDKAVCEQKIAKKCLSDYTNEKCSDIEYKYQEFLLGGMAKYFLEIDPKFAYKFVARSGEKYMAEWAIQCTVSKPGPGDDVQKEFYNLYTMVKVLDQAGNSVYESVVHQKSLGSTFYINAQTGFSSENAPKLQTGHAYSIRLYYFLPWDGEKGHELQVDVSILQMILYRTKN